MSTSPEFLLPSQRLQGIILGPGSEPWEKNQDMKEGEERHLCEESELGTDLG
jgi:hypothetical protein